jgi:hypothetical protein
LNDECHEIGKIECWVAHRLNVCWRSAGDTLSESGTYENKGARFNGVPQTCRRARWLHRELHRALAAVSGFALVGDLGRFRRVRAPGGVGLVVGSAPAGSDAMKFEQNP